jgi:hypothetical protein
MGDHAAPRHNAPSSPSSSPCRELLDAIGSALRLPAPATRADELSHNRLRSQRAAVALDAINRALRDSTDAGMRLAALDIGELIAGLPASIYDHSGLES